MADLDTLRPEVREAAAKLDDFNSAFGTGGNWTIIRTELLRLDALARELNEERGRQAALRFDERIRAEKAEAELAALKARIVGSVLVTVSEHGVVSGIDSKPSIRGKRAWLVVVEE